MVMPENDGNVIMIYDNNPDQRLDGRIIISYILVSLSSNIISKCEFLIFKSCFIC